MLADTDAVELRLQNLVSNREQGVEKWEPTCRRHRMLSLCQFECPVSSISLHVSTQCRTNSMDTIDTRRRLMETHIVILGGHKLIRWRGRRRSRLLARSLRPDSLVRHAYDT
jgi:hypothetical protein